MKEKRKKHKYSIVYQKKRKQRRGEREKTNLTSIVYCGGGVFFFFFFTSKCDINMNFLVVPFERQKKGSSGRGCWRGWGVVLGKVGNPKF